MFNTNILDVAIGLIFIYLLLSLMCTAANEIIELMLKKRAIDLERGIRELLVPGSNSGTNDVVQKLYNHPLVNGLFGGRYENSGIANRTRWVKRTDLPSYIPARNFSLALMDLILPGVTPGGGAIGPSGATGALAGLLPPTVPAPVVVNVAASGGTAAVPPAGGAATGGVPPQSPDPNPSLIALRDALVNSQLSDQIKQGLVPLLDAAGNDVARARENIEGWYNASMDRVSSWYKRRAQITILILGLFIAITVNVDTITIAKRLSTDKALRESLVAAADAYAKANAEATPAPSPSQSPAPPVLTPSLPAVCVTDAASTDCQREKDLQEACKVAESPKCKYLTNQQQLQSLGLPIGWESTTDPKGQWPGANFFGEAGWWDQIYWHGLGWLLTALALSLGAPFWFDLLNKFIVIRSAVKPHEKSPEEGSKD